MLKSYAIEVQLHEHLADLSRPVIEREFEDVVEGRIDDIENTARHIAEAVNTELTMLRKQESGKLIKEIDHDWHKHNQSYSIWRIIIAFLFATGAIFALILAGDAAWIVFRASNLHS
jgi:hypothetical protein